MIRYCFFFLANIGLRFDISIALGQPYTLVLSYSRKACILRSTGDYESSFVDKAGGSRMQDHLAVGVWTERVVFLTRV